jgi:hypothetical protein
MGIIDDRSVRDFADVKVWRLRVQYDLTGEERDVEIRVHPKGPGEFGPPKWVMTAGGDQLFEELIYDVFVTALLAERELREKEVSELEKARDELVQGLERTQKIAAAERWLRHASNEIGNAVWNNDVAGDSVFDEVPLRAERDEAEKALRDLGVEP